ncbi:MAG: hypothetical protein J7513_08830 [Solirubrobacteraceae bacterium]|nr:hypothetical protein [Solirubrobacteraceae bacterium]
MDSETTPTDDLELRAKVLKWILIVAVVDLVLFLPLIYGVVTGNKDLTPLFGPLHGIGFMVEVGLTAWGAMNKWWGWWYPIVTVVTTGPPGALIGHGKAKRETLGS